MPRWREVTGDSTEKPDPTRVRYPKFRKRVHYNEPSVSHGQAEEALGLIKIDLIWIDVEPIEVLREDDTIYLERRRD